MAKRLFKNLAELKDLSGVPESNKKRVMEKNVLALEKTQEEYKTFWANYDNIKSVYDRPFEIKDDATYKLRREITKQFVDAQADIVSCKSRLSKYINALLYDHNCASGKHNNLTVEELYSIVNAYENEQFRDNYFPKSRIRAINKNNFGLYKAKFQLEVAQAALAGKYNYNNKDKKYWKSIMAGLNKKIELFTDRRKALDDTFRSMQYAKLIKQFDELTKKIDKKDTSYKNISSKYVIDFENITKYYYNKWIANKILKGFDLKIKQGEFVVILGPSGSGKTTLLNIMSGMDKATYGRTIVNSNNLIKMTDNQLTQFRRDNIGYIFQQYGLLPNLTVRENVEIGWNLQTDKTKRLDIDELLKTVGMSEHAKKFPYELSGGQQQRVSVARSMAKNPAIVFGDEPTGAVDEEMSKQILQLFVDINKKFNTTVIIVTHNPIFAGLATRVIKVNSGCIAQNYINKNRKTVNQLDWSSNH